MSTRALSAVFALSFLAVSAAACAPSSDSAPEDGNIQQEEDSLGASQRSYVVIRRDYRKCAYPMCSGWYVHDVNRKNAREAYVAALDFADSGLDEATQELVRGAPDGEVVLYGKLGDLPDWEDPAMKTFRVQSAWRGMPGDTVDEATEIFYETSAIDPAIQCLVAPCATVNVKQLHKTPVKQIERIDLAGLAEPLVDRDWLADRALWADAIVAGAIVDGEVFQGGPERVLAASQVFLRLPEEQGSCPQSRPNCPEGQSAIYTRDENRCVVLSGCVEPGACAAYVPACGEGYTLQSWTGGMFACTQYACDPSFVVPAEEELPAEEETPADDVDG
jgi:hypothetical protein